MATRSGETPFFPDQARGGQNHVEYMEGELLVEMINADLIAKRISIDGFRDIIRYLRDHDKSTCHRLEGILAFKGQRAGDGPNPVARIVAGKVLENSKTRSP